MTRENEAEEMLSDLIAEILHDVCFKRTAHKLHEERQSKQTEKDLKDFGVRLLCSREANISDILTGVRVACGVAVVTQKIPAIRTKGGDTILNVKVRFLPNPGGVEEQFVELAKKLQAVMGVNTVTFKEYDGAPLVQKSPDAAEVE